MRVAIFGTGGAGGYFGAKLALAGNDVRFIARGAHLSAIREHGLILETESGETAVRAFASDDPSAVGPVDVVLLGVKTWQVTDATRVLAPLLDDNTFVVPLQNGVEAAVEIAGIIGKDRVLDGLCGTITRIVAPGRLRSIGSKNFIAFGEFDNRRSERAASLLDAFTRAGVQAEVPADIRSAVWKKFAFSAGCGGVCAASRSSAGVVRSVPETRATVTQSIGEVVRLGIAMKVGITDGVVDDTLRFLDSLAPESTPSLLRDIADGKPSELEAWTGAVVRLGREAGIETPVNSLIYSVLLPQEQRSRSR